MTQEKNGDALGDVKMDERLYRHQRNGDVVFDIETVPDELSAELKTDIFGRIEPTKEAIKKGEDAVIEYINKKKAEIESDFALSPLTGRIDGIGIYIPETDLKEYITFEDERRIIETFMDLVIPRSPRLISFNGKSFDAHFIKVRSAKLGVHLGYDIATKRYDLTRHFDVREALTNFGASPKGTLRQWALFFGLTPAPETDFDTITKEERAKKCLTDCDNTYDIYQRIKDLF